MESAQMTWRKLFTEVPGKRMGDNSHKLKKVAYSWIKRKEKKKLSIRTGCQEGLWSLSSWIFSRLYWAKPCATCLNFILTLIWAGGCSAWCPEIPLWFYEILAYFTSRRSLYIYVCPLWNKNSYTASAFLLSPAI